MLDLLDLWLLCRGIPSDDRTVTFQRINGYRTSNVIYFLPWHTPFYIAKQLGPAARTISFALFASDAWLPSRSKSCKHRRGQRLCDGRARSVHTGKAQRRAS